MDHTDRVLLLVAILVSSTLYFVLVFVAALAAHNMPALYTDITAVGVTYLFHTIQAHILPNMLTLSMFALTIILGAAAGLLLLV